MLGGELDLTGDAAKRGMVGGGENRGAGSGAEI